MGLSEVDDLLDPAGVSDTLKCPVCFEVFDDPVFCGGRPCQHIFCRQCLEKALERGSQCPTCRAEISDEDVHPHQAINSLLDELPSRCSRGCGWTGRRDARAAHAEMCPLRRLETAAEELATYADVARQLEERDERIAELEARLADKDNQVVGVSRQLVAREVRIQELERREKRLKAELGTLHRQLRAALGEPGYSDDFEDWAEEQGEEEEDDEESNEELPSGSWSACHIEDERHLHHHEDQEIHRDISSNLEDSNASVGVELWL
mmetsp:Transcript_68175/g.134640  ORF Transcript_68175/g.134640 Transcript_68175/m.134640 type:complete len:265 (+) Transcript_68175:148-942(+)|eukprot:CAMPEP_0172693542 /NCGR_PEP_ID=MMETSP1074-20121228/26062_1 /TAXON_ID=2916 /ORGANISM="Ceratium fusus, Strain PA161109" /LENGTH=264 /DNA_ID=CAMNT_0013513925 /DNA_START=142 /DNA_END=936 /DNA_ORIENTATION=-